jgi:hypothetical protein
MFCPQTYKPYTKSYAKYRFIKHGFIKHGFIRHGFIKHKFIQDDVRYIRQSIHECKTTVL